MWRCFLCVLCASVVSSAADYRISARLDPASRTLTGEVAITFTNEGEQALDALRLHLYWNAFRDRNSSFMRESRRGFEPSTAGWIDFTSSDPPSPIRLPSLPAFERVRIACVATRDTPSATYKTL